MHFLGRGCVMFALCQFGWLLSEEVPEQLGDYVIGLANLNLVKLWSKVNYLRGIWANHADVQQWESWDLIEVWDGGLRRRFETEVWMFVLLHYEWLRVESYILWCMWKQRLNNLLCSIFCERFFFELAPFSRLTANFARNWRCMLKYLSHITKRGEILKKRFSTKRPFQFLVSQSVSQTVIKNQTLFWMF